MEERNKREYPETVSLLLPRAALEFADFYAELGKHGPGNSAHQDPDWGTKRCQGAVQGSALPEYPGDVLGLKDFPFSERLYVESDRGLHVSEGILTGNVPQL